MKQFVKSLFYDREKPSAKRIYGSLMFLNAILGKNVLCYIAMFHPVTNFSLIDSSLDSLLFGGVALYAGTIVDKWSKNTETNS